MNIIYTLKEKLFDRKMARQRYKRGYADEDCWGLNYWLTTTFPKMIITLRDMKHGAPDLPFEEFDTLPEDWKQKELLNYQIKEETNDNDYEPYSIYTKWYIILTRMAYCLEEANSDKEIYNPYETKFMQAVWGDNHSFKEHLESSDGGNTYELKLNEPDEELKNSYFAEVEKGWKYKNDMKDEALELLSKYFYCLWD